MVFLYLKENKVKDFPLKTLPILDDASQLVTWRKNNVKVWKILIDSMKNHLVYHLSKLDITKKVFDSLKKLFECDSSSRSISLRTHLHTIKMNRSKFIDSYLMRIVELRY